VSLIEAELGLPVPLTAFPSTVVEANRTCADLTLASRIWATHPPLRSSTACVPSARLRGYFT
jgi:hypothetical protein